MKVFWWRFLAPKIVDRDDENGAVRVCLSLVPIKENFNSSSEIKVASHLFPSSVAML